MRIESDDFTRSMTRHTHTCSNRQYLANSHKVKHALLGGTRRANRELTIGDKSSYGMQLNIFLIL